MQNQEQINELIIGADVSKDKIDLMILPLKKIVQIANTAKGIKGFLRKSKKLGKIKLVVCEATGGYELCLLKTLGAEQIAVHVAHPNRVYHFAKGKGVFAKTDNIDAATLALYGCEENVTGNQTYEENQVCLEQLSSRSRQVKEQLSQERNRLCHPCLTSQAKKSVARMIKVLEGELELLKQQMGALLEKDVEKTKQLQQLKTFKGVGEEIARTLVIDLPELGKLNRSEVACLVGLAPRNRDSGKKAGRRFIQGGRAHIRKLCYIAALVSIRYDGAMKIFYERLKSKGKAVKVALIAVARKILLTLNSMVKNNTTWQQNRIITV